MKSDSSLNYFNISDAKAFSCAIEALNAVLEGYLSEPNAKVSVDKDMHILISGQGHDIEQRIMPNTIVKIDWIYILKIGPSYYVRVEGSNKNMDFAYYLARRDFSN